MLLSVNVHCCFPAVGHLCIYVNKKEIIDFWFIIVGAVVMRIQLYSR